MRDKMFPTYLKKSLNFKELKLEKKDFLNLLGELPPPAFLNPEILERIKKEDFVREKIIYQIEDPALQARYVFNLARALDYLEW